MKLRPDQETREKIWKKVNLWVVFLAVAVGVVGIAWGVNNASETKSLAQENLTSQTNHHNATKKQQDIIIGQNEAILALTQSVRDAQITNKGTLTAIQNLETEVATVITQLPAADAALASEATGLATDLMALCESVHADCKPLPTVP